MADIDELFDGFDESIAFETSEPTNPIVIDDDAEATNGDV